MAQTYAILETSFILNDPKFVTLKPAVQMLYIKLWVLAVDLRKEVLTFQPFARNLSTICRVDVRGLVEKCELLAEKGYILYDGKNDITMLGVKDKHKNLKDWICPIKLNEINKPNGKEKKLENESKPDPKKQPKTTLNEGEPIPLILPHIKAWTINKRCTDYEAGRQFVMAIDRIVAERRWTAIEVVDYLLEKIEGFVAQCKAEGGKYHMGVAKWVAGRGYYDDYTPAPTQTGGKANPTGLDPATVDRARRIAEHNAAQAAKTNTERNNDEK